MTPASPGSAPATAASLAALTSQDPLGSSHPSSCPPSLRFLPLLAAGGGSLLPATSRGAAQGQLETLPSVPAARAFNLGCGAGTRSA